MNVYAPPKEVAMMKGLVLIDTCHSCPVVGAQGVIIKPVNQGPGGEYQIYAVRRLLLHKRAKQDSENKGSGSTSRPEIEIMNMGNTLTKTHSCGMIGSILAATVYQTFPSPYHTA